MEYKSDHFHWADWSNVPDSAIPERKVESNHAQKQKGRRYIPSVPLAWFDRACVLPGKALAVGLILWRLARMKRSNTVVLTSAALTQHGLRRWAKYDALRALEDAGLVAVYRRPKRNPEVTLLTPEPAEPQGASEINTDCTTGGHNGGCAGPLLAL
jgi:hypothetical protein